MSQRYDNYLAEHKLNVKRAYDWLVTNLPGLFEGLGSDVDIEQQINFAHDESKMSKEEYDAYDRYWYGGNKSYKVVNEYEKAWMHHVHNSPHHWQHWIYFKHDDTNVMTIFEMPMNYILEMLCDWWSFGWASGDVNELFTWYEDQKDTIKFHDDTRKIIEGILNKIKVKLEDE